VLSVMTVSSSDRTDKCWVGLAATVASAAGFDGFVDVFGVREVYKHISFQS